jgi:ubiquitin C-terminal hydrolase
VRGCRVAVGNEVRRRRRIRRRLNEKVVGVGGGGGGPSSRTQTQPSDNHSDCSSTGSASKKSPSSNSNNKKRKKKEDNSSSNLNSHYEDEFCALCEVERLMGRIHSRPVEMVDEALVIAAEEEEEAAAKKGVDGASSAGVESEGESGDEKSGGVNGVTAVGESVANASVAAPQDVLTTTTTTTTTANNASIETTATTNTTTTTTTPNNGESGPVIPEAFVSGFMSQVAPWFRRGVQEDSHEFLRLLIDAMQNSCKVSRNKDDKSCEVMSSCSSNDEEDVEYPFRLFRGTVESNVKCSACRAVSCKIDPIEDIGLDILPVKSNAVGPGGAGANSSIGGSSTRGGGGTSRGSASNSRSTSPTSAMNLAAVQEALERFISIEHLDSGYKCEKCGKLGKATKTSKLASIPPILTLHLKRFRYGSISASGISGSGRAARGGGGASLSGDPGVTDYVGPSGSAKIEGHVAFKTVLDIKPFLTPKLQETSFKRAFCRLFAVVVHTGKNSHSGHYVAYVLDMVKKNVWWKMDDGKVVRSSWEEVSRAEAYMLFYRVMDHPVAKQLKEVADAKTAAAAKIMAEIEAAKRAEEEKENEAKNAIAAIAELADRKSTTTETNTSKNNKAETDTPALGKRKHPDLSSGVDWAKATTSLPEEFYPLLDRIEEFIAENVTFNPDFFGYITEECNRMTSKISGKGKNKKIKNLLGKGPGGVYPPDDVQGGATDIREGILDLFHQFAAAYKAHNRQLGKGEGDDNFLLPKTIQAKVSKDVVPITPQALTDEDLIIPGPDESFDGYDGAL